MRTQICTAAVADITPLTNNIIEVVLAPQQYIDYIAGQYLQIEIAQEFLSYSIANAPLGSHTYELHIRHDEHNSKTQALFAEIKAQGKLTLRLPLGDCHFNTLDPKLPILFIAGGTGFAPVKAMIEQLLALSDQRLFEFYWGARSQSDLYMDDKVRQWTSHVGNFKYFTQLAENLNQETLASRVIRHHENNIFDYQIVICGPFDRTFAIREALVQIGVSPQRLHSDAFNLIPP